MHNQAPRIIPHERNRKYICKKLRTDAAIEHRIPMLHRLLPERTLIDAQFIPAPHVVDQNIQPPLLGGDSADKPLRVFGPRMIAGHCFRRSACAANF
ncbi:hypothetical protein D3C72_2321960 [compost metagenome]